MKTFSLFRTSIGIALGTILYDFVKSGLTGIDWYKAVFVACFSMSVLWLYHRFELKTPKK